MVKRKDLRKNGDAPSLYLEWGGFYDVRQDITELKDLCEACGEKKAAAIKLYKELTRGLPVPLDTLPGTKPVAGE